MEDDEILQEEEIPEPDTESDTESEPQIYTGPNIFAMALMRFQVFRGGLPPYVKRAVEKFPEIQQMIVPVSEVEDMKQRISQPGTNESQLFRELQKKVKK